MTDHPSSGNYPPPPGGGYQPHQPGSYPPPQQGGYPPPPQQGGYPPQQQGGYPPPGGGQYPSPQGGFQGNAIGALPQDAYTSWVHRVGAWFVDAIPVIVVLGIGQVVMLVTGDSSCVDYDTGYGGGVNCTST